MRQHISTLYLVPTRGYTTMSEQASLLGSFDSTTLSSPDDSCRCFICWEPVTESEGVIRPCQCKDSQLSYAHQICIDQWVNASTHTKCSVCTADYKMDYDPLPVTHVVKRHFWLLFSFFIQILVPVLTYGALFYQGRLATINKNHLAMHLGLLIVLYVYLGVQVFSAVNRFHRRVKAHKYMEA